MSVGIGRERQFEIYIGGARGTYPAVPVSFERLEQAARKAMSPEGYAYVAGGAGTEETMRENRAAFERWRIVPRMLRDVSVRATATEVLGTTLPSPFVLCPIGVLEMAHRDADVAVARAAAAEGIPFVFSNQASRPMEEAARAMGDAPRWFQLYWSTSDELVASLVSRAERCGCSTRDEALDQLVRRAPVELEPARGVAHRPRGFLHGSRRLVGEDEGDALGRGRAGDGDVGVAVCHLEHADRAENERARQRRSQHLGRRLPDRDVAEHPRNDPPALERRAVLAHRLLGAGAARDVREALWGHGLACGGSRRSNETGTAGYVPRAPLT